MATLGRQACSMAHARDIVVRSYLPADLGAIERITLAAYGFSISPSLRTRANIDPQALLVAEYADDVSGLVAYSRYGHIAYIASMAVDPTRQRLGIARALMAELIVRLEDAGVETMLLDATSVGAPLYAQAGFSDCDLTHIYERRPARDAMTIPTLRTNVPAADLEHVLALDREIAGCDRADVVRAFTLEPTACTIVEHDGYAIARERVLGPWLARTPATALRLYEAAFRAAPRIARVFVPESNSAALALLESQAFARIRTLRHMTRGRSPMRREHIYGQASPGHG